MSMFCNQCQETAKNEGCTVKGVCGLTEDTANQMDLLIYLLNGISLVAEDAAKGKKLDLETGRFVTKSLFSTITNTNFDSERISSLIIEAIKLRDDLKSKTGFKTDENSHDSVTWSSNSVDEFIKKGTEVGILSTADEDIRSLRSLLLFGLKGIAAYAHHAEVLGYEDEKIYGFIIDALAVSTKDITIDELISWELKAGEYAVKTMELLDKANTETYGHPEITKVNIGTRNNPGILISGHDLKDLEELLEQTKGTGVDVYTHSEMLPANYYPAFKKYDNFVGNYGNAWWQQQKEFASFNGPILMTTNCIITVKDSYKDRIYTTNIVGYPEVQHIPDRGKDGSKDFSKIIEQAKKCSPPEQIEEGEIVGGFAHDQVLKLADKIIDAVKSGALKRFFVMAGCDGRQSKRKYFTDVATSIPEDTVILTAGCAKYRYNKLDLGDIGGIPRVIDAGQCNDSYSLAVVALKLKEVFELDDINDLPISFDLGWYEQKAVAVLLALLFLGVKGIRLGPTLPAFLSPNVAKVLVENFDIKLIGDVKEDIDDMMGVKEGETAVV